MRSGLSVAVITKNASGTLRGSLNSIKEIASEIVLVDELSTDETLHIAKEFKARIYKYSSGNQGMQKNYAINRCRYEWILILDSDEIVGKKLKVEIIKVINNSSKYYGFEVPYRNHLFNKPLYYGGESYSKLILFKKKFGTIEKTPVHEKIAIKENNYSKLKNKMLHYSYRSLGQMYRKFTDYAVRDARQKVLNGENSSLRKILMYPLHMLWARFIQAKGYKDGVFRIVLDLGFAYMEFLTYLLLLVEQTKKE